MRNRIVTRFLIGAALAVAGMTIAPAPTVKAAAIQIPHSLYRDQHPLSCEAGALRIALSGVGVTVSEDWINAQIPVDSRAATPGGDGGVAAWGDPFQNFVGDINGSESRHTGYGVYDGPIAVAARRAGTTAVAGEGWDPTSIYQAVLAGHPVVAWVINPIVSAPTHHYRAYDGRIVPWSVGEHAVAVVGVDTAARTVTVGDPIPGTDRTVPMAQFEGSFAVLGNMAVVLGGVDQTIAMLPSPSGKGYLLATAGGQVHAFGDAATVGGTDGVHLNRPLVGAAPTPDGRGYWFVASDGGVFPVGDAVGYGSTGSIRLNQPIVGLTPTPSGRGYWLVASDGGVFPFGDAGGYGSTGNILLNQPVVGLAATPDGRGYWLVASDGGIFPFGNAGGFGSTGGIRLNRPIFSMSATRAGDGYWLVASDGGVFPFGRAGGYGSAGSLALSAPVTSMLTTHDGGGYWMATADGHVLPWGDAVHYGGLS